MVENYDPLKLLAERLTAITGSSVEDERLRLEIIDRIAKYKEEIWEHSSALGEKAASAKEASGRTHLVIALVGLITIGANFAVSYFLKAQDSEAARELASTNATLAEKNTRLQSELDEAKSESGQARANESRGLEFQYTMIDKIMSKEAPDAGNTESTRAKQIAFLYKMGLMDRIDPDGFTRLYETLVGEKLDDSNIGFPTLPTLSATEVPVGSKLTRASNDDLIQTLGEPAKEGCQLPLADVPVPFTMDIGGGASTISVVRIHEALALNLKAAFDIIKQRGLENEARQFGGILSDARHRVRSSFHNWAAAIDLIPSSGIRSRGSVELASAMEDAGFRSTGLATNDDWSHFEVSKETLLEISKSGYKRSKTCG